MDPYPGKVLLTPKEVWTMLGMEKSTFYRMRKRKEDRFPRPRLVGGQTRYRKDEVLAWVQTLPEAPDGPAEGEEEGE
jgi:excisionase family DNA binding protein